MDEPNADPSTRTRVVVTGDLTIDEFEITIPPAHAYSHENPGIQVWRTSAGFRSFALPGDTLLLSGFVNAALNEPALAPSLPDLGNVSAKDILHAHFSIERFPRIADRQAKDTVYRIEQYKGFTGPDSDRPSVLPLTDDRPDVNLLVLDDAGNGFREERKVWPAALEGRYQPLILLKMGRPIARGSLWDMLRKNHGERLVVVVNAEDLRREGVYISRRLSWERTAMDFVWQLAQNSHLAPFHRCACLVVRFGVDGAILCMHSGGDMAEARLFFDPKVGEDGSADLYPGRMRGLGSVFTAALAGHMARSGLKNLSEGVRRGILASRRLMQRGYGTDLAHLAYPGSELFGSCQDHESAIVDVHIPPARSTESADPEFWCILNELSPGEIEEAASNYVVNGTDAALDRFPVGIFHNLRTVDRSEIESYRSIQNLIREYVSAPGIIRPISIAVFGAPGSGKSFGITQVAESVAPGQLHPLEFNLSQLNTTDELSAAFHRVRDVTLSGKIPFVFFDEFDSDFHGPLGWLKYFLAPMQAGRFRDRNGTHPIGRGIFVFAGGTFDTFAQFYPDASTVAGEVNDERGVEAREAFRAAKGPDFASRLRGYVNLKSINQEGEGDDLYMIRRALLLRFQLYEKARHVFRQGGTCQIDPGVLRALLKVPSYKHGVRSMSALIDMSMLFGRKRFERASLPAPGQLELHVDAEDFFRLVMQDVLWDTDHIQDHGD